MEMTITFRLPYGFLPCFLGIDFEIRDGLNQSANLLGIFCEVFTKERVFRSSGHQMYLKLHDERRMTNKRDFYIKYRAKPINITGL